MIFLGIETSCDETSAALVQDGKCLGHIVHSQDHRSSGGVIPQVAAREHLTHLSSVIHRLWEQSNISPSHIHGIGVTAGPGLVGGLLVGIMWAKGMALASQKPLWPVHHLEAHALMARMERPDLTFPYLLLLLSGGHCLMTIVKGVGQYHIMGQTLDDAAGECLDKVARAMGGPYPGGPYIEQMALKGLPRISLPIPLIKQEGYHFSFSGLKTACLRWIQDHPQLTDQDRSDLCASLQKVIAQSLCSRVHRALIDTGLKRCVISGGVAANQFFRTAFHDVCTSHGATFIAPPPAHCTDNGLMVAWATYESFSAHIPPSYEFPARPRWSLTSLSKTL